MSFLINVSLTTLLIDEKKIEQPQPAGKHRWWCAKLMVIPQEDPSGIEYEGSPFESWGLTQEQALEQLEKRLNLALEKVRQLREDMK